MCPPGLLAFECHKHAAKPICAIPGGDWPMHEQVLASLPHFPGLEARLTLQGQHRNSGRVAGGRTGWTAESNWAGPDSAARSYAADFGNAVLSSSIWAAAHYPEEGK